MSAVSEKKSFPLSIILGPHKLSSLSRYISLSYGLSLSTPIIYMSDDDNVNVVTVTVPRYVRDP